MDMLSTALNRIFGLVNASVQDATNLLNALKTGSLSVDDLDKWYRRRRSQGLETLDELGNQIQELREQAMRQAGMRQGRRRRRRPSASARRSSGLRRRAGRRAAR